MDFNDRHSRKETSLKIGAEAEQFAHDYLLANGLIPVIVTLTLAVVRSI